MERKKLYLISAVVVVMVTIVILINFYGEKKIIPESIIYSKEITETEKLCETDEDCSTVQLKCCPLFSPVFVSVNNESAKKINQWKTENCLECKLEGQPSRISLTLLEGSKCEKNKCQTKYTPYCKPISANCNADLTEQELNQLNMTQEEVLEYCGC